MINFLQINVGKSPAAQKMELQTAIDVGAEVIIFSEQCGNQGENHGWFDSIDRSTIFVDNSVLIEVVGPPENGFR